MKEKSFCITWVITYEKLSLERSTPKATEANLQKFVVYRVFHLFSAKMFCKVWNYSLQGLVTLRFVFNFFIFSEGGSLAGKYFFKLLNNF